jgi:hypothetical protein
MLNTEDREEQKIEMGKIYLMKFIGNDLGKKKTKIK